MANCVMKKHTSNIGMYAVTFAGDYNDGDYVYETYHFTPEQFDSISDVLSVLSNSWGMSLDNMDSETYNKIGQYVPSAPDNDTVHTVELEKIQFLDENSVLYDVEIKKYPSSN